VQIERLKTSLSRFQRLPPGNAERILLGRELGKGLDNVAWQVDELAKAVDVAERDPGRFNLDQRELAVRRTWVRDTRGFMDKVKLELDTSGPEAASQGYGGSGADRVFSAENDAALKSESEQQSLLLQRQDEDLDDLSGAVTRLGQVGLTISNELESQSQLIDELNENTESTMGRLKAASRKMEDVIKKSGMRGQCCIIVCLTLILGVLVYLTFHS
tara:strand:- start:21 stop:668 length:648 start_codon:yes stop_codon:yes gene_type:complete